MDHEITISKLRNPRSKNRSSDTGEYSTYVLITIDGVTTRATIGSRMISIPHSFLQKEIPTLKFDRQWASVREHPDFDNIKAAIFAAARKKSYL